MMTKICVIGLGYVGKPLAALFAKKYRVIGFDNDEEKVRKIKSENPDFLCTYNKEEISDCDFFIIAVPTPVDENYRPNLQPLISASHTVGNHLKKGNIVIYESTVYPGVTEDICVPVLEEESKMKFNKDFFVGYSPERINPSDEVHTIEKIKKITSGSTKEAAEKIDNLYNSVLKNGTFKTKDIKTAEAAKIIENCQRDVNIAFINELAKIFNAAGIDTHDVLEAAATKWNFIKCSPGLVGGHCISVDPYYLIQKAEIYGVMPMLMLSARQLNDSMGNYVANQVIRLMNLKGIKIKDSKILILGFSFKENCPDVRNSKTADIFNVFKEYTDFIEVYDPVADKEKAEKDFAIKVLETLPEEKTFDAIILTVAHDCFKNFDIKKRRKPLSVVYDVKGFLDKSIIDARL